MSLVNVNKFANGKLYLFAVLEIKLYVVIMSIIKMIINNILIGDITKNNAKSATYGKSMFNIKRTIFPN